jgi:predicted alpha/beta-hydrolase family hydrolase
MSLALDVAVDAETTVRAELSSPRGDATGVGLVLGHGAGGDMHTPMLVAIAEGLAARGHAVLRFNFPYAEAGRRAPDRPERLEQAYTAAVAALRAAPAGELERVVLGGKSLGGRIASMVVAKGLACDGLVFLGYPLHPAGKPKMLRDKHLDAVKAPMLFLQGTRDPLCDLALLKPVVAHLSRRATLHVVDGGDHSLELPKSYKRPREDVWEELCDTIDDFLGHASGAAA